MGEGKWNVWRGVEWGRGSGMDGDELGVGG